MDAYEDTQTLPDTQVFDPQPNLTRLVWEGSMKALLQQHLTFIVQYNKRKFAVHLGGAWNGLKLCTVTYLLATLRAPCHINQIEDLPRCLGIMRTNPFAASSKSRHRENGTEGTGGTFYWSQWTVADSFQGDIWTWLKLRVNIPQLKPLFELIGLVTWPARTKVSRIINTGAKNKQ